MDADPLSMPESLRNITGIGKERIMELKARVLLGLRLSADEPMRDPKGQVVEWISVLRFLNREAKHYMLRSEGIPLEDSIEWRDEGKEKK